jgi:hypothetical protein
MIPAPIQPNVAFEDPNPPLTTGPEPKAPPEPALPFMRLTCLRAMTGFGQDHLRDRALLRERFVRRRNDAAIPRQQVRRAAKALLVGR